MKKLSSYVIVFAGLVMSFYFVSCEKDDPNAPFVAVQDDLNMATNDFDLNVTGKPYGDATISHNGSSMPADSTFRDIFTNLKKNADDVEKGTIITKHTYLMDNAGMKSDLQVTFAMIKRESGYFADGGDWEYVMMPFDASVDYTMNPNGLLPDTTSTMRGKLANCASCHASGGTDYIFIK
ncbi:MAG: hypothetical protein HOG05_16025 [Bacteroidetes bacterium]|jgi:hypothetical protein|nr:hypothetical protein [Bacteroidota bacterium]MBT4727223.1 hypothetical protein [Bacteroidota bacterium]MBT6837707.1 hypothetical protein [Bacteroidota bacterium]MBT7827778.1 hypothetical protein [Bacteroidota bacterium]